MALMATLFKRLNIPLAKHKVVGPCTVIEYLGIILDTEKIEARLPQDDVIRIRDFKSYPPWNTLSINTVIVLIVVKIYSLLCLCYH